MVSSVWGKWRSSNDLLRWIVRNTSLSFQSVSPACWRLTLLQMVLLTKSDKQFKNHSYPLFSVSLDQVYLDQKNVYFMREEFWIIHCILNNNVVGFIVRALMDRKVCFLSGSYVTHSRRLSYRHKRGRARNLSYTYSRFWCTYFTQHFCRCAVGNTWEVLPFLSVPTCCIHRCCFHSTNWSHSVDTPTWPLPVASIDNKQEVHQLLCQHSSELQLAEQIRLRKILVGQSWIDLQHYSKDER